MVNAGPPSVMLAQGGGPRVVVSTAAFHARVRGSVPGLGGLKETKLFLPHPRVKVSIVGSLRDREVACSASDRQGSNFESCVWRTVSSQSSHHPQEVLLAQFSLYVHKGGLKPDSFHFILMLAHMQRGTKHDTVTQYVANISPVLGQRLVFSGAACDCKIETAEQNATDSLSGQRCTNMSPFLSTEGRHNLGRWWAIEVGQSK